MSYNKVSDVYSAKGQLDLAREQIKQGLAVAKTLTALNSKDTARQLDLAASYEKLGDVEVKALRFVAAGEAYERDVKIREAVAKIHPEDALLKRDLAMSYREFGDAVWGAGQGSTELQAYGLIALSAYQKSFAMIKELTGADPNKYRLAA